MCGIAGFFGDYNPNLIKNMTDSLYRRGPDEEGFYQDELCSLGIRRLSIIDLKSGSQPYFNEDKRYVCVFNGEIYNFKELRGELEKKGHRFRGFSDGEILPHLYEDHKEEAFAKLRGMFAFALYDKTEKKLILARDHFGIKPLFYFIDGNKIYFASEIKAFKKIDFLDRKIDSRYLNNYFYLGYSPGNSSIYEKIKKLPPAGILIFSQGRENIMKYWSFPKTEENKIDKNFLEETSFILEKAVREQTVSDVPLGIFLSGGMDSSSILYFAGAKGKNKVKTF
ncbi:MAG: asparagine synthase (glutamine-hydrolyzing), partial [Elusimicrobia bacterium]|nr:asparagine synthase (glutamine-hydrolyzing) [Elusimicrobiota bacterium]